MQIDLWVKYNHILKMQTPLQHFCFIIFFPSRITSVCVCVLRFHVVIDFLKPEKPDPTVSLKGVEHIDVPSLATRKYKLSFYTYKEGQYQTRVSEMTRTSWRQTSETTPPSFASTSSIEPLLPR